MAKPKNLQTYYTNVFVYCKPELYVSEIIEWCQLSPMKPAWKTWKDSSGNLLIIQQKDTYPKVKLKSKDNYRDLYFKTNPQPVLKEAEYLVIGYNEIYTLVWLWSDQLPKLRLSLFKNQVWQENLPPLLTGTDLLSKIIKFFKLPEDKKEIGKFTLDILSERICDLNVIGFINPIFSKENILPQEVKFLFSTTTTT